MKSTHFNVFLTTAKLKTLFPIREVTFLYSMAVCKAYVVKVLLNDFEKIKFFQHLDFPDLKSHCRKDKTEFKRRNDN